MVGRPLLVRPSMRRGPYSGDNESGCWLWTGGTVRNGNGTMEYGKTNVEGRTTRIHRAVYEAVTGQPLPPVVRHTCNTPLCFRPCHLLGGTQQDNADDMTRAGRQSRGADRYNAIPWQQVQEIRASPPSISTRELMKLYGVSRTSITMIRSGSARREF